MIGRNGTFIDPEEFDDAKREAGAGMTTEEVKDRLIEIALIAGDNERAHAMEDALHLEVLREIAKSTCRNPRALAREAVKSRLITFDRWYA